VFSSKKGLGYQPKKNKKKLKNYFVKPNNHMTQIKHVIIVEALIT
jgi:hypothetical protein